MSNVFATCDARQSPFIYAFFCILVLSIPNSAILQHKIQGEKKIYGKIVGLNNPPPPPHKNKPNICNALDLLMTPIDCA